MTLGLPDPCCEIKVSLAAHRQIATAAPRQAAMAAPRKSQ
jgi:hypothetical protein